MSGNALWDIAIYHPPDTILPRTQQLATEFNCPVTPSSAMMDCLRKQDARAIDAYANTIEVNYSKYNLMQAFVYTAKYVMLLSIVIVL